MAINVLDAEQLFYNVNTYATRHGFTGGFPVFYQARYNAKPVYGAYFLRSGERMWVPSDFLKDVQTAEDLFEAVNQAARTAGFSMGFPTFTKMQIDFEVQQEAIFLERSQAGACLLDTEPLGITPEDGLAQKIHKVQAYARTQGFTSALPCGEPVDGKLPVQMFHAEELTWKVLSEAELQCC